MDYSLIHQDAAGVKHHSDRSITYLQLVKHLTFAGIDRTWFFDMPFRYLGNFFEYAQYYQWNNGPMHPLGLLDADPTERNYLSNRIGRALADHLSKKIYNARYTHSYECAMHLAGLPIAGPRPDFYCDTGASQFAVEAKGFSSATVSNSAMQKHKLQAGAGPLQVNFAVASVAYNLYDTPHVKFYDPVIGDAEYANDLNFQLRENYYRRALSSVEDSGWFESVNDRVDEFRVYRSRSLLPSPAILIHDAIVRQTWRDRQWNYERESINEDRFYVDNDGIGVVLLD